MNATICQQSASDDGSLGTLGNYELVKRLGDGGMAQVYLARRNGRHVALKVLAPHHAALSDARSMFMDEARVAGMLDHPNIAAIYDVDAAGSSYVLAMEYVHGVDLRNLLATCIERGELPSYEVTIAIVMQAAAGLDHAHRRCAPDGKPLRLVHRDVSLSNVMVTYDGVVKVVDFGIAQTTLSSVETNPGVVRGKASYMAPEQCQAQPVDHRADVFALGIVLYELLTGARCFDGASDLDRMLSVVRGDYVLPSMIATDLPADLEAVVRKALAPDPRDRFHSCAAMIAALTAVLAQNCWIGGAMAVTRMMKAIYGDVPAPVSASRAIENHSQDEATAFVERRLARGSYVELSDVRDQLAAGEMAWDEQVTIGRPTVRRSTRSTHSRVTVNLKPAARHPLARVTLRM